MRESDIGVKMGIDSNQSAIEAANIILKNGKLEEIVNAIIYGRNMIISVKKFIE